MNSPQLGLRVASVLAALIGVGHVLRLLMRAEVTIGTCPVGVWPSVAATLVAAGLAAWFWRLAARFEKPATPPS